MSATYWTAARPGVRRAMSLQDVNPASATYGCCDRSFWQYRTIASYPAGTMQQVAWPFAVLFETAFSGNEWFQQAEMLERARAAMLFWSRAQHSSGAVDEWYRNEHSYCATAFTTFAMAEACLLLQSRLTAADRDEIGRAISRAALWLAARFNDDVMNQNLAASAALWNAHQLTGDARFKIGYERTWQRTCAHQDTEGWFLEYGGADLGYSLLALDLLAALDRRGSADAAPAAASLGRFVASFAVGASDLAGRLGSRGTEHAFPFGVEAFAASIPECNAIAAHLRAAVERETVSDPRTVDDRYLAYFYLPSFVCAASLGDRPPARPEAPEATSRVFANSGFRVWRRRGGDVVCSTRRNAAFNVYTPEGQVHRNLGYWLETSDGHRYASCAWSTGAHAPQERNGSVMTEGACVRVDDGLPLVRHEVAFRAATGWVFRWPSVAEPFHRFIKRRKIARQVAGPFTFSRELTWCDDVLTVNDIVRAREGAPALRAVTPAADIEVHSPSARLSGSSPNHAITVSRATAEAWAAQINTRGYVHLVTTYALDRNGWLRLDYIGERAASSEPATVTPAVNPAQPQR